MKNKVNITVNGLNKERINQIEKIIAQIEQVCNNLYSPDEKMGNMLFSFGDKLSIELVKLNKELEVKK